MKSEIEIYTIERVKEIRVKKDMSQRYFADCLNVSQSFIQKIENPETDKAYNLDHLNEIAKILNCSMKDFIPDKPL